MTAAPERAAGGRRARAIAAIVRKDLRVALGSQAVLLPFLIVPIIFVVIIPIGVGLLAPLAAAEGGSMLEEFGAFSPSLLASLAGLTDPQKVVVLALEYMFAPLFLVLPLMFASILAADSFAGEKERKTLEPLIYSPIADRDLLLAKMLSAWVPAVAIGLAAFVVYIVTANAASWPVMGRLFLPTWMWLVLVAWVMPGAAAIGLGASVLVSARVSTFQEAYQVGGIVVLPIVALVIAQATGVIYFSVWLVVVLGVVLWAAAGVLLSIGGRSFRRSEMITRL